MTIFLLSKKVACSKLLGKLKCAKSKSTAHVLKARLSSCIKDLKRPAHKKSRSRLRLSRRLLIELLSLWRDICGRHRELLAASATEVDRKVAF